MNLSGKDPKSLEEDLTRSFAVNVIGVVHLYNLFIPLILKGKTKKVIALSTGLADDALTVNYDLEIGGPYSASKAALNTIVAKYAAELSKEGVLFLALSPGVVEVGKSAKSTFLLFTVK